MGGAVLMFILKVLEGKFPMEKGQQEVFRKGCSRVIKCNGQKWSFFEPEWGPKQQCHYAMQQEDELVHLYSGSASPQLLQRPKVA